MTRPAERPKKIMIIKTGEPVPSVLARRGEFADLIAEAIGHEWLDGYASYDARTDLPPDPNEVAAFIITGSAANVPTREPWMLQTEGYLRDVVSMGVPTFGICFGHQILAQALGGEVRRNPRGREIGTIHIERFADDPLFDGIPDAFYANATHLDTVALLPKNAVPLAKSTLDDHHAIRFTPTCYGVQFHPELDADVMRAYVEHRREILAGEGFDVDTLHATINEAELGRRTMLNFIRHILPRSH
ncbi:glutamine amidotransferase [Polyangium aurulentum]|uniref:glutamine amidotransferase n=1 Tax=Polyangium aurulentum TaxID=2567896 RepID=UPI0010ADE5BA|nr:glutamine amidotransferase [Polyangium aurulentum]UQA63300.1 glutamine amidotransferase [Polyangium aurulentum]